MSNAVALLLPRDSETFARCLTVTLLTALVCPAGFEAVLVVLLIHYVQRLIHSTNRGNQSPVLTQLLTFSFLATLFLFPH